MCDPVTIASAAVAAAGSGINSYEQNRSLKNQVNARNAATMAELERQKKYGTESRGIFDTTMTGFSPDSQAAGLKTAQGNTAALFGGNAPTDVGTLGVGTAPAGVAKGETRTVADVFRNAGEKDISLGNLTGYGQQMQGNKITLNSAGRDVDMVGDFSKTSSGVSGLEQRAAYQNAYRPPSGIGDLLQFAGNVGSFQGGKGAWGNSMFNPQKVGQPLNLLSFMKT